MPACHNRAASRIRASSCESGSAMVGMPPVLNESAVFVGGLPFTPPADKRLVAELDGMAEVAEMGPLPVLTM